MPNQSQQPQSFSRRDLLLSALSATAVSALPGFALAQPAPSDARFTALLDTFADEILRLTPTTATSLGMDKDGRAALKSQLEDASPQATPPGPRRCNRCWAGCPRWTAAR